MKINESWLRELANPAMSVEAMGAALTMAGLELDGIEPAAAPFSGVVVAKIESLAAHPDADKLRVCQVNVGDSDLRQVVCGAANAAAGMIVALAEVGAELPGEMKIRKAKLRGVESYGMLCSASELGLAESSSGIMSLPESATIGLNLRAYLDLDDQVLDIDLTPNRADCFSVTGVARELAIIGDLRFRATEIPPIPAETNDQFPISVAAAKACPVYAGRIITGINFDAETPVWMAERLRRCGIRSLNPIVDITNYVMLEIGQPMHAFDLAKLDSQIVVRFAESGEQLTLLDGNEITLNPDALVIADQSGALALAGIMGGESSAVNSETTEIFLESAFFPPTMIAGKARQYGLHTESSLRFERGVDFTLQQDAIERATGLILDVCGGQAGPATTIRNDEALPEISTITLHRDRVEQVLGIRVEDAVISKMLVGLGCETMLLDDTWHVMPPPFRFDLTLEVDLIEEVARLYGYDNIPAKSRSWAPVIEARPETQVSVGRLKARLNELGYQEVITYSFVDASIEKAIHPQMGALALANPISADLAVMRTTLWGGLLQTVRYNQRRQQNRVRIFESGLVFIPGADSSDRAELDQKAVCSGAISGDLLPEQWGLAARKGDFFDIKGDVESLLQLASLQQVEWRSCNHQALHPGQAAELFLDGQSIGTVGALHPGLQNQLKLDFPVFLFELSLAALEQRKLAQFKVLPKYPSVRRDLALLVDVNVTYSQLSQSIDAIGSKLIREYEIFDVYTGKGVTAGRKSLALSLILQDFSSTLSEDEVDREMAEVMESLQTDIGATLRE